MKRILFSAIAGAGLILMSDMAAAQPAAAPMAALKPLPPSRGLIVALDSKTLTLKGPDGAKQSFAISDDTRILRLKKINPGAIKAGSFVATANVSQPDGSGVSTEFRVFAPALRGLGEGHGPMAGEAPGTMMTNGTVSAEVVSTPRGREMDVTYGGKGGQGVRHIVIPPNVTIREMSLAARADLTAGAAVEIRAGQAANGALVARAVLIGENGQPPAN